MGSKYKMSPEAQAFAVYKHNIQSVHKQKNTFVKLNTWYQNYIKCKPQSQKIRRFYV